MEKLEQLSHASKEDSLLVLLEKSRMGSLTIHEILEILSGKGSGLLLVFLSLPFCQPLQIPGLSIPFGLVIIILGLRMGLTQKVALPKSVLAKTVSPRLIDIIITKGLWLMGKIKSLIRPRLSWICRRPILRIAHGLTICLLGLYFVLPVPIPFSNIPAAWAIFLISLGLLEDDGLLVCLGYTVTAVGLSALIFLGITLAG